MSVDVKSIYFENGRQGEPQLALTFENTAALKKFLPRLDNSTLIIEFSNVSEGGKILGSPHQHQGMMDNTILINIPTKRYYEGLIKMPTEEDKRKLLQRLVREDIVSLELLKKAGLSGMFP